jgi:hypothetical protein
MYESLLFWLWIIAAFLFGVFLGKNNSTKVQELGEKAEAEIKKGADAVEAEVKKEI